MTPLIAEIVDRINPDLELIRAWNFTLKRIHTFANTMAGDYPPEERQKACTRYIIEGFREVEKGLYYPRTPNEELERTIKKLDRRVTAIDVFDEVASEEGY